MDLVWSVLATLLAVLLCLYFYLTWQFNYWKVRKVEGAKPILFFGNFKEVLLQKKSPGEFLRELYVSYTGLPYAGFFIMGKPALLIRDPDLIKKLLIKDFASFPDHYADSNLEADPLVTRGLFISKDKKWKQLRSHTSPTFTSGRLKKMFHLVLEVGQELRRHLREDADLSKPLEVKELMAKTSTDVITTCAFGINSNCISNPNAEFREFGKAVFDFTFITSLSITAVFFLPRFAKLMKFTFLPRKTTEFLRKVFWDTLVAREESKTSRNDLIDQLIQLKNKGKMDDDENDVTTDKPTPAEEEDTSEIFDFCGDDLLAQAAGFYLAGYESSSSTLSSVLYELALATDIQDRVRREVNEVMERHGGQVTYEGVNEMKYLDMVVAETLRKYPSIPFLDRVCVKDYVIPDTGLTIEKGTPIFVPLLGLHYDSQYFPEPEKFDPERFSDENKHSFPSCSYMPFGEGPRNCIGLRFAMMATKTQLANILSHIEVTSCAATPVPLVFNPQGALLALAEGGIPLKFRHV